MKTRLLIDGSAYTGSYRVTCDCAATWSGRGEAIGAVNWSPALPVAECVVHIKIAHSGAFLDLQFTELFREWLVTYWERANLRLLRHGKGSTFGLGQEVRA